MSVIKKAFITGIAGMDGNNLTRHLLKNGYEVYGIVRRDSIAENQQTRLDDIRYDIHVEYGDLSDAGVINRLLKTIQPDEIYNLAAMSHVRISFDKPQYTAQTNAIGVLNMLEAFRTNCPNARFYQASSSECFGSAVEEDGTQNINTPFRPVSPYGAAKVFGFNIVKIYRESYNLFACNGILFNHTDIFRGSNFVECKIIKGAIQIKLGLQDTLELGNLDAKRDIGASKDYVKAMNLILNHYKPKDWVVATGETRSIRDICDYIFRKLGMDYEKFVKINPKFLRPNELPYLKGDSCEIRYALGWKPDYTFEMLIDEMVEYWTKYYIDANNKKN